MLFMNECNCLFPEFGMDRFITLLELLSSKESCSVCSLFSISSHFLSLSLNRILEKQDGTKIDESKIPENMFCLVVKAQ